MTKYIQTVTYEGGSDLLVWKHPKHIFYESVQLVVQEAQEAVVLVNGKMFDTYDTGKYPLFIQKEGLFTNPDVFLCDIYFVNTSEQMAMKWGTDSRIELMEPTYHFPISIGASGEMSVHVVDAKRFIVDVVGVSQALSVAELTKKFRALLNVKVKTYLAKIIRDDKMNIFEIDERLNDISRILHGLLVSYFAEYGLSLDTFFVTTIAKPDGEAGYERFKDLYYRKYTDVEEAKLRQQVSLIDSKTQAEIRLQEGYTIQQEQAWKLAHEMVEHSQIEEAKHLVRTPAQENIIMLTDQESLCKNCGAPIAKQAKFCSECGSPIRRSTVCSNCGTEIRGEKYCPECGQKQE